MSLSLEANKNFEKPEGIVLLVIADGVGIAEDKPSNAVTTANTPNIDDICKNSIALNAHGTYVGLPSDSDIGNSEVGHNAMGAGRIFDQGARLVNKAISDGTFFESSNWNKIVDVGQSNTVHFIGLHSDGVVHSDIAHLHAMLNKLATSGVNRVRIHSLLDGRDTPIRSALTYLDKTNDCISELAKEFPDTDYVIASGGGRMKIVMDRYQADWEMVRRGYECITHGVGRQFSSAIEAVETMYQESDIGDQYLEPFVVADSQGEPIGRMADGDAVVFYNFRGDRSIEISRVYEEPDFDVFDRGNFPEIFYVGMLEYDGDLHIPRNYLVAPPKIDNTVSQYLVAEGIKSFAVSETQKFGHVTYFWNGNKSGYIDRDLETYVEVPSDNVEFNKTPAMKAKEITDVVIELIEKGDFDFGRLNFANGDMVGHTGDLEATVESMEAIDVQIARLKEAVEKVGGVLIYTADHGNADVMYKEKDGVITPVTSHTLSPVPFAIYDSRDDVKYELVADTDSSLGNIAATLCELLGYDAPADYLPSLLKTGN